VTRPAAPVEAVVAVIRRGGRVLVIERAVGVIYPGYWTLPSGRIERGETQPQAIVREMREELGLAVRALKKVWECPTDDGAFRLHWWTVSSAGMGLKLNPAEVGRVRWVDAAGFAKLQPTFAGDHEFFRSVWPTLTG
jgi:8-oxo-dGTP diphosphatase